MGAGIFIGTIHLLILRMVPNRILKPSASSMLSYCPNDSFGELLKVGRKKVICFTCRQGPRVCPRTKTKIEL